MATRKASDSNISGKKYTDASAGAPKVADVPQTPSITSVTDVGTSRAFNNGQVSVALATAARGGVPASYTVTSTPGSFQGTGTSPITVQGLSSATSYTFIATGTTATGTSPATPASASVTATTVPAAPTIGTVTVTNTTTLSVPFTAGATGGKTITSYSATSSPSIALSVSGTTSPLTVTGSFASNTAYTITIAAVNANGTGASSSASNSVSPNIAYSLQQTFNTSGTFTMPSGKTAVAVMVQGGGAAGAQGNSGVGGDFQIDGQGGTGGRGGGVYFFKDFSTNSGTNFTVTVGGSNGTSSFGNLVTIGTGTPNVNNVAGGSNAGGANGGGGGQGSFFDVGNGNVGNFNNVFNGSPAGTANLNLDGLGSTSYQGGAGGNGGEGGSGGNGRSPQGVGGAGGAGGNTNQQGGNAGSPGQPGNSGQVIVYVK